MSSDVNGILNISKEAGYTSFDVVALVRGIYRQKKCGHTGTLDPMAEGVLPVALGKATKVCGMITDWDKEYIAELLLGKTTDTLDVTGKITGGEPDKAGSLSEDDIRKTVSRYKGDIDQIPPMYSALKKNGKKLYELARSGKEVERQARRVTIHEIEILSIDLPVVKIRVLCSKGTYIRSLCDDIGRDLGCGGCMKSLIRSKVGPFVFDKTVKIDDLKKLADEGKRDELLSLIDPVDSVFGDLPACFIKPEAEKALSNGNKLLPDSFENNPECGNGMLIRVYGSDKRFAAVYRFDKEGGCFKPDKMF